ncbi:biotin transporter BioY [Apilactobacillus nanyangensis]|uniref:Biotin transporter n=1 Tax=Apilactobacillus nanyangensis TaxID=2799579 RepID=A0ABT0HXF0_9LACO|nr:biotin transporter BioY [Apilactobacillus nanyangensis]MCK8611596.1 biotin transporter BioY [Apilactobacillus nanyangensis]
MKTRDITQIALMTALIIALAFVPAIPVAIIPVPIVLQNFGIMLAGLLLGGKKGTISVALLMVMVAVGLPVLTGGHGGAISFIGPSGGYLLSWLLMPSLMALTNKLLGRFFQRNSFTNLLLTSIIVSIVITYLIAIVWISVQSHITLTQSLLANMIFAPGDILKAIIAVFIAKRLLPIINKNA